MNKHPLTATRLRLTLSTSLFLITLAAGAAFYFIYGQLQNYATDVSHKVADASASQNDLQTLQQIQRELEEKQDVVTRASNIVADSKSYLYQDQIIHDLNDYAKRAGITITNMDFTDGSPTSSNSSSSTTKLPSSSKAAPSGLKSTSVTIAIKNPVGYDNFLRFVNSIEDNLTKMQVSKVGLSKGTSGSSVTSENLTIQVYIR